MGSIIPMSITVFIFFLSESATQVKAIHEKKDRNPNIAIRKVIILVFLKYNFEQIETINSNIKIIDNGIIEI